MGGNAYTAILQNLAGSQIYKAQTAKYQAQEIVGLARAQSAGRLGIARANASGAIGAANALASVNYAKAENSKRLSDAYRKIALSQLAAASITPHSQATDLSLAVMDKITPQTATTKIEPTAKPEHKGLFSRVSDQLVGSGSLKDKLIRSTELLPGGQVQTVFRKLEGTSPGKKVLDLLQRPVQASGGAIDYLAHSKNKSVGGTGKAAWAGLSDKTHVLPSTTINQAIGLGHPTSPLSKIAAFTTGLASDIFLDPTTYIPIGGEAKIATKLSEKALPSEVKAAKLSELKSVDSGVLKSKAAQFLDTHYKPIPEAKGKELSVFTPPRFTTSATGVSLDTLNPVDFAYSTVASKIADIVNKAPELQHPNLNVESPFIESKTGVTERVPHTVTEEVKVNRPNPKAGTIKPPVAAVPKAAQQQIHAIRMMLTNNPDHVMSLIKSKGKPITVGDLLETAKKSTPARQADIKTLLNQEAAKLYHDKAVDKIPNSIQFIGRSGNPVPMGLSKDQAIQLFTEGKIPTVFKNYGEKENEFTSQFPLHSVEDIKTAHVIDETGKKVTLHEFLKNNNVDLKTVDLEGNEKSVIHGQEPIAPFELPQTEPATIQQTVRTSKTVYTNVNKINTSVSKLKGAQYLAWMIKHSNQLSKDEMAYLREGGHTQFEKRLGELKTKQVVGNYKTLDSFIEGAKNGLIPQSYLDQIFSEVGVKSLDELKNKATAIIKKTGEAKVVKPVETSIPTAKVPTAIDNIKKPAEIIQEVSHGNTEILAKPHPEITASIRKDVNTAIDTAMKKNVEIPGKGKGGYVYKSNKGTLRTSKTLREGLGRNLKGWNSFSQGDALRSLIVSASTRLRAALDILETKGAKQQFWKERSRHMYEQVMPALQVLENQLGEQGVKIIAGHDESGILMSIGDVLTVLPQKVVEKHLFSPPMSRIPTVLPTGISNAAEPLVNAAINKGNMELAKEAAFQALMDKSTGGNYIAFGDKGKAAATELVNELVKTLPAITEKVYKNYAEQSIKIGQSVTSMSDEVVNKILGDLDNPVASAVDTFSSIMDKENDLRKAAVALKAPSDALPIAKVQTDTTLVTKGIEPGDLAEAVTAKKIVAADTKPDLIKAGLGQQASRVAEANSLSQLMGEKIIDVNDYMNLRFEAGLFRSYIPVSGKVAALGEQAGRAFVSDYKFPDLHDALWGSRNTNAAVARAHRGLMSKISKYAADTYGVDAQKAEQDVFKALQAGGEITDPKLLPIAKAMKDSIDLVLSAGENGHASLAIRNGLFTEHLNKMLKYYHAPGSIKFDEGRALKDQADVWRSWENVTDPLDALDRVFAAHQFALTDSMVGRTFSEEFGVTTPRPGYIKLTDKGNQSILHKFIDSELYYPEVIARQIPYYDEARNIAQHGIKGKNIAYVISIYDKAMYGLKTGFTVLRPGHHVSNLMGDIILNMLAGTTNPLSYRRATRVLAGRSSIYKDWDGLKALRDDEAALGAIPGKNIKVGKIGHMTDDEVWRAAHSQGLLSEYHMIQDLEYNDTQQFNKLSAATGVIKRGGTTVVGTAGKVADVISHSMRMAQFIDVLNKSKGKTIQEAIDEAGRAVRKWHPDGSDLTPFERKYAKRTILFYSWMRKSTPLILQSIVQRPGRALVVPKASYNFAQVMGINPDSLSDPYPQGMLLPSFLSDNIIGPQWTSNSGMLPTLGNEAPHKFGFSLPGDPLSQTVDNQVNNPIHSILGGLSPVIKVPIEEATKTNLGTGAPITNQSEYIDQQLPLVSNLSNILNKSVAGGLTSQQDVAKGNTSPGIDKNALINFLTGVGVRDYSKLNYKKAGLYDLRDKYKKQAFGGK